MKVFLTDRTFNRLVSNIEINMSDDYISKTDFRNKIFEDVTLYFMFNQLDLKRLLLYKEILANNGEFKGYNFVEPEEDSKRYVFSKGGAYKYHLSKDCISLNRSYVDVYVPEAVREKELTSEFRHWFIELNRQHLFIERIRKAESEGNNYDIDSLQRKVTGYYNIFFSKHHQLDEIDFNNEFKFITTGSVSFSEKDYSFNIDSFKKKINHYLMLRSCLPYGPVLNILYRNDYLYNLTNSELKLKAFEILDSSKIYYGVDFFENFSVEKLKNCLRKHYTYKSKIKELIKGYYRWTYSFDEIEFKVVNLETLGLKCCGICIKNQTNLLQFLPS